MASIVDKMICVLCHITSACFVVKHRVGSIQSLCEEPVFHISCGGESQTLNGCFFSLLQVSVVCCENGRSMSDDKPTRQEFASCNLFIFCRRSAHPLTDFKEKIDSNRRIFPHHSCICSSMPGIVSPQPLQSL